MNQPSRRKVYIGRTLTAVGALAVIVCAVLMGYGRAGGVAERHRWSGGPIYLTSAVRGGGNECTITPAEGQVRRVTVPAMPNRGPHLAGRRLAPWFTGSAQIACTDPVHSTTGWIVRLYPLVEQWLVLAAGIVLTLVGLARLGLFRHTSRYP